MKEQRGRMGVMMGSDSAVAEEEKRRHDEGAVQ